MPRRRSVWTAVLLATGGLVPAAGVTAPSASAVDVIAVTTTADGVPGSLRAAVVAASAAATATVVSIPPGTYDLTRCGVDDSGDAGDLDLRTAIAVTFRATGQGVTIRQTCSGERVLHVRGGGRLVLDGVTVTGGSVTSAPGTGAEGGGVSADGDVTLLRSVVTGNSARGGDGSDGAASAPPGDGGSARGGGLRVGGRLVMVDSVVRGNTAAGGTGGDTPPGADATGGTGGAAEGGGAVVSGALVVTGGAVAGNAAVGGAGGAADGGRYLPDGTEEVVPAGGGGDARGGGVAQAAADAPVTLTRVRLADNRSAGGAIGTYRTESVQIPPQGTVFPPAGDASGGAVAAGGRVTATDVTAAGDQALGGASAGACSFCAAGPASGAALGGSLHTSRSAAVVRSRFSGARAASGEAFFAVVGRAQIEIGYPAGRASGGAVDAAADLTLTRTTITGSTVRNGAGRPRSVSAAAGGAARAGAALVVSNGTFTGNTAGRAATDLLGGAGGALAAGSVRVSGATLGSNLAGGSGGAIWSSGAITATRTAITDNQGGWAGGGAHADGTLTAVDVQVRGNVAAGENRTGGGGGLDAGGAMRLTRTTVTGNAGRITFNVPLTGPIPGQFTGGGLRAADLVAVDSTVAGNTVRGLEVTTSPPPRAEQVTGGGIFVSTSSKLTNTTVNGNRVDRLSPYPAENPARRGGGVSAATLLLVHATVTANLVTEEGPEVPSRTAPESGTLQADELTAQGSVVVPEPGQRTCVDGVSAVGSSGYDVFGDGTCGITGPGVRTSAAGVNLGALADNGGPVPTQLPGTGSTLVDAVPAAACRVAADARGVARPQGPGCDIGAVEVARPPVTG